MNRLVGFNPFKEILFIVKVNQLPAFWMNAKDNKFIWVCLSCCLESFPELKVQIVSVFTFNIDFGVQRVGVGYSFYHSR